MRYLYRPSEARRLQQIPSGPGSNTPARSGDIIDTDNSEWVDKINSHVAGEGGLPALVPLADKPANLTAKDEPTAQPAASELKAGASADLPDLSELTAAKVVKLAQSLGYPGERRKPDALEFLAGIDADKVAAALADLLND